MEKLNGLLLILQDLPGTMHFGGEWLVAILLAVIAWLIRSKTHMWDKHITDCHTKSVQEGVDQGKNEQRLTAIETQLPGIRSNLCWVGDCIWVIGTKIGADLPERPE